MKAEEFFEIRKNLRNFRDFKKYNYFRGTLFSILSQKRVENVKRRYHVYVSKLSEIENYWEKEKKLPSWLRLPPVMRLRLLMKSLGMSGKEINKQFLNPEKSELEELIWNAIYKDFLYSPIAAKIQFARGRIGEIMIRDFLEAKGMEFKEERELRNEKKTPDFVIEDELRIDGRQIRWIESKALFGDLKLHRFYLKKQYDPYAEIYGDGIVIYWLGKIDELKANALIKDYDFIQHKSKKILLEMKVFFADKRAENLAENINAEIYEWKSEDKKSKKFLKEILDLFQKLRGNLVITGYNRNLRTVLRNMGFEIITLP